MRVRLSGIHKFFETDAGVQRVLQNLNLEVAKGDFIAIMGPSGSGKSTLLFLIGCLDIPSFGKVILEDTDVTQENESMREKIRLRHIGFIFQSFYLMPNLSVSENVLLPMQLLGLPKKKSEGRALSLLRLVGLEKKANDLPNSLSGGQQQRTAIARALANMPGLILADEPTGNLDTKSGKEVMEVIRSINENQGLTTIVVTHDPKIASYAKQIYYLSDGKLRTTVL
ncbi:MAG: ABC transporter ATP-binding protein [Candidatus Eremiobacteraeota bacterium]|nr:ABC transporter ATP-binding protein [Candidatus Eremiobacteraeota bacterium]